MGTTKEAGTTPETVAQIVAVSQVRVWDLGRSRIGALLDLSLPQDKQDPANRLLRDTLEQMQDAIEAAAMQACPELTRGMCIEARRTLHRAKAGEGPTRT